MKIHFLLISVVLFLLSGCAILSSNITFTPVDGLSDVKITARTVPAKVSEESVQTLKANGYAYIGFVESEEVVKTCWDEECGNFECSANLPHKDTLKELLEKAAASGGDLLLLKFKSEPAISSTEKQGKCITHRERDIQVQYCCQYDRGYCQRTCYRKQTIKECSYRLTIYGKKCSFVTSGAVWRHDPELIKDLAKIREEKELKLAAIEREQKRLIAEKEKYAAIKKAYEANLFNKPREVVELVSAKVGDKYCFKDKNGKIIIEPLFTDTIGTFSEGLAAVAVGEKSERKWGFIDKTGTWVIRPHYDSVGNFSEGLAAARIDKKYGYINKVNQFIITPQFQNAGEFYEGIACVCVGGKFGYIDKKGNIIIEPQFDMAWRFSDGLAAVKVNKKYGYIDKNGNFIIKPQFDYAYLFVRGMAKVDIGNKEGFINKAGEIFMQP